VIAILRNVGGGERCGPDGREIRNGYDALAQTVVLKAGA
jgi:hypothetical protein